MSFTDFAFRMFPYWCLGAAMAFAIWKSDYKSLLRFDKNAFAKFFSFMVIVSIFRYAMIHSLVHFIGTGSFQAVNKLPIGAVLFVPWENLAHSIPLVLFRRMIGTNKWTWPIHVLAMLMVMVSFGMGHVYQGIGAAIFISLAIPLDIYWGKKVGFGTTMSCHVLYDFLTIMTIRLALG